MPSNPSDLETNSEGKLSEAQRPLTSSAQSMPSENEVVTERDIIAKLRVANFNDAQLRYYSFHPNHLQLKLFF